MVTGMVPAAYHRLFHSTCQNTGSWIMFVVVGQAHEARRVAWQLPVENRLSDDGRDHRIMGEGDQQHRGRQQQQPAVDVRQHRGNGASAMSAEPARPPAGRRAGSGCQLVALEQAVGLRLRTLQRRLRCLALPVSAAWMASSSSLRTRPVS